MTKRISEFLDEAKAFPRLQAQAAEILKFLEWLSFLAVVVY